MKEILLIEDTEGDALLLERALRAAGVSNPICHVSTGADALFFLNAKEQALQRSDESELGIVFFDLKLPDKSGFDLLKLLQERKAFSNTLKVVISQIEDMENIKRAYTLGVRFLYHETRRSAGSKRTHPRLSGKLVLGRPAGEKEAKKCPTQPSGTRPVQ